MTQPAIRDAGIREASGMPEPSIEFAERWVDLRVDLERGAKLVAELQRELAPDHELFGVTATAVARCGGHCDAAMFKLDDGRFAVVHLSYPKSPPDRAPWPMVEVIGDWDAMAAYLLEHEGL